MSLVFSLPFCLSVPDGDYELKLDNDEIVTLNLTKVIPKVYDERIPWRGFLKGELEKINFLRIWNKKGNIEWKTVNELAQIKEMKCIIEYRTKDGKEIFPESTPSIIEADVNIAEDFVEREKTESVIEPMDIENSECIDRESIQNVQKGRTLVINAEVKKDPFGRFRYTKIRFTSAKIRHFEEEFNAAIRAVNIFVTKYRRITQEYWIHKIREEDVFLYKSSEEGDLCYATKGIVQVRPDHKSEIITSLCNSLVADEIDYPFFQFRLDAKNALEQASFHLAVIYSIIALESLVKTFLFFYLRKDEAEAEKVLGGNLSYLVKVRLAAIFPTEKYKELTESIVNDIRLRNVIIHEGELSVSREDSERVVQDVDSYFSFLGEKFESLIHDI